MTSGLAARGPVPESDLPEWGWYVRQVNPTLVKQAQEREASYHDSPEVRHGYGTRFVGDRVHVADGRQGGSVLGGRFAYRIAVKTSSSWSAVGGSSV